MRANSQSLMATLARAGATASVSTAAVWTARVSRMPVPTTVAGITPPGLPEASGVTVEHSGSRGGSRGRTTWVVVFALAAVLLLLTVTRGHAQAAADSAARAQAATPPPAQAAPVAATSGPPALGLGSWVSDRRSFTVGDVITVLVDEQTIASADKSNIDSADRSTNAGLSAANGAPAMADIRFGTRLGNDSRERGQARRSDRLATEISVRVVEVDPSGILKVEGTKTLLIDKQEQQLTLSGYIRPQDISARNVVDSWRLGNAQLAYSSKGDLGKPKRGILSKILGILWP